MKSSSTGKRPRAWVPSLVLVYGTALSSLAVVHAGMATAKEVGFAKGGATGNGMQLQRPTAGSVWDVMSQASGMRVASNGQLVDDQGLEGAGIVHKNEYVIPVWMREDPQVL